MNASLHKARYRDSADALRKLTVTVDGQVQIKNDPPLIMPGEELLQAWGEDVSTWYGSLSKLINGYRRTLQSDRRRLLDQFSFVQFGFKVVGVGSVGTRAWIILLDGAMPRTRCSCRPRRRSGRCWPTTSRPPLGSPTRASGWCTVSG